MELRDRLVKTMVAVGVVAAVLFFFPGPGALYDLGRPWWRTCPKGATLIATSCDLAVHGAAQDLADVGPVFCWHCRSMLWQVWDSSPGFVYA